MARRPVRHGQPFVASFAPSHGSGLFIYAVAVKDHPGVVKVGMTTHWGRRRKSYARWNLATEDAVTDCRVFILHEEWADLPRIERSVIDAIGAPLRFGREWFVATIEDVGRAIESVLDRFEVSFSLEEAGARGAEMETERT